LAQPLDQKGDQVIEKLADKLRATWVTGFGVALMRYRDFVAARMAPNTPEVNHMGFAIGLMAEAGEYGDLVKKEHLHHRPNTPEHQLKKKHELGDVFWYWMAECITEGFDPSDVIAANVEKLEARANDAAYAAKNPNVPSNFGKGLAERLLPVQLAVTDQHSAHLEALAVREVAPAADVGAGFVECQICKRVRTLGQPACCYVDGSPKAQ
jgi:NTP pyrophosphatase (non-canonical NTP hydrolase)